MITKMADADATTISHIFNMPDAKDAPAMPDRYGQGKKGGIRESKNYGIPEWHSRMAW